MNIFRFRLGLKNNFSSFTHIDNQYFNALTLHGDKSQSIYYIDGGAYNGDTLMQLVALRPINRAYLFEPDQQNFSALCRNVFLQKISAQCLPLALSDKYQVLTFNSGIGEAGTVSQTGTTHIAAMALDDLLNGECVDLIKLDVEGGEIDALKGASKTIEHCRPIMAISIYHRPTDLWEIPKLLRTLCKGYQFFIRQHYYNSFDSVLYAVPVVI